VQLSNLMNELKALLRQKPKDDVPLKESLQHLCTLTATSASAETGE